MRADNQKPYTPAEGLLISDINRAWTKLEKAEHERELALHQELMRWVRESWLYTRSSWGEWESWLYTRSSWGEWERAGSTPGAHEVSERELALHQELMRWVRELALHQELMRWVRESWLYTRSSWGEWERAGSTPGAHEVRVLTRTQGFVRHMYIGLYDLVNLCTTFLSSTVLFFFSSGFSHHLGSPEWLWISFFHFVLSSASSSKLTFSISLTRVFQPVFLSSSPSLTTVLYLKLMFSIPTLPYWCLSDTYLYQICFVIVSECFHTVHPRNVTQVVRFIMMKLLNLPFFIKVMANKSFHFSWYVFVSDLF